MKSLLMGLALVLSSSIASANTVTALATRIETAVTTAGVRSSSYMSQYLAAGAGMAAGANPVIMKKLETVASQVESVAKDNNDDFNGLPKAERLEALQLIFASLVEKGKDASVDSIANGSVLKMFTVPVTDGKLDLAQFKKLTAFLKLVVDGKDVDVAAVEATGIKTTTAAELASKCGAEGRR
jgi:hypothetical protein